MIMMLGGSGSGGKNSKSSGPIVPYVMSLTPLPLRQFHCSILTFAIRNLSVVQSHVQWQTLEGETVSKV